MRGFPFFLVLPLVVFSAGANATQVILNPIQDAGIFEDFPDNPYGSYAYAFVGYDNGWADTLMQFDLTPYLGIVVESAYLELYVYSGWGTIPTDSWVDRVAGSWNESTVTWNNSPGYDGNVWFYIGTPTFGDWFRFEVTGIVETWIDGSFHNYGFYFARDTSTFGGYYFSTKEFTDNHPRLEFNYHDVSVQPTSLGSIKSLFK